MTRRLWPLYAGGFLGPFGASVVTTMLPELAHGLHTDRGTAASSLTVYMVPFAAVMLVSGTLAEHWGRRRTVRAAYLGYVAASVWCAVAPNAVGFLAGRALQGTANAFTTPLLVAAITDLVPRHRLARSLGMLGAMQAAGQTFAPLAGGLAATVDYRWAFFASAAAAGLLATMPPPDRIDDPVPGASRWRSLATRRLALACGVAFGLYLCTSGSTLLVALLADDRFGLGPDQRGLVLAAFGLAGLLTAPVLGGLADRGDIVRFGIMISLAFAAVTALIGPAPSVAVVVLLLAASGAASTAGRVVSTTLAVTSAPTNRGGATSMALAWQFLGSAMAPVLLVPIYGRTTDGAFVTAASGAAMAGVLLTLAAVGRARRPRVTNQ